MAFLGHVAAEAAAILGRVRLWTQTPVENDQELMRDQSPDEKLSGLAFKVAADPYIGTLTFYRTLGTVWFWSND